MDKVIKTIVAFSLKNKYFIFFLTLLFAAVGIVSYINTPIVAFPDFTNTNIHIITQWSGRSAEEVERFVTIPIETAMNAVQRKSNLRSRSMFGLSDVNLIFEDDVEDMYGRQQITALLADVELPEGASASLTPPAGPIDEIYRYTLKSPVRTPSELRILQDWVVERNVRQVPGVADVVTFGGPVKTYEVSVNPNMLAKYDLDAIDVYDAIQKSNINVGSDVIEKSDQAFVVRGIGLINDIPEIENITITNVEGTPILVKNVALVKQSNQPRLGQVGYGKDNDAVESIILMRKGIDPGPVLKQLKEKVAQLNSTILPPDVKIETFYDRQNLIDFATHTVIHNVVEGILLVTGIILLFMFEWRTTLIVALVIPLSLLFAFMCLRMMGMFANLISIGAIDFGIIVDGAVVMVEGIFVALAHRAEKMEMERFNKLAKGSIIKKYGVEMGKSIFFAKLIIITALIPIFAFQKVEGKI
ncbi:MAG TPA: efflux RND transporter permease subunit, partial [Bacteroidia bacterium]